MKLALIVLGLLILFCGISYAWLSKNQFGVLPGADDVERFKKSKQYNSETGRFQNQIVRNFEADMDFKKLLKDEFFGEEIRTPTQPLPEEKPDWKYLTEKKDGIFRWIWLGHSTFYFNINGTLILVDPLFSASASPISWIVKRFQPPVVPLDQIPSPDIVLISHDHYDHLDAAVIRHFAKNPPFFITTLGVGSRLKGWGIPADKIVEMDWHEKIEKNGISFTAAPAQHFSGRSFNDRGKTFWSSWVLNFSGKKIFISGDTGYAPHFKEIGTQYGPFDFAFIESGQYNPMWSYVHLLPEEVVQAAKDLGVKAFEPMHWGMFVLALHDWFDPIERVTTLAEASGLKVWQPEIGQVIDFDKGYSPTYWWRNHPDFKINAANNAKSR
jgi:L-ascorbate metabolism protein UlaG (beta-lactamase superfamily)